MNQQFYAYPTDTAINVPEVGQRVRVWLKSNGATTQPNIQEGTVTSVEAFASGALRCLELDNEVGYYWNTIGTIELA